jgi:hypothetical protein
VDSVGKIDTASKEVKESEAREVMEQAIESQKKREKRRKNKMRGKGKVGREMENKTH